MAQTTPVPAHAMQLRKPRRSTPSASMLTSCAEERISTEFVTRLLFMELSFRDIGDNSCPMALPWRLIQAARIAAFEIALFHDDLPGHVRVDAAEVRIFTGRGKCESELVVSIKRGRLEPLVGIDDRVGYVIAIDPSDSGANWYVERLRRKREVVDGDLLSRRGVVGAGNYFVSWQSRIGTSNIRRRRGSTSSDRGVTGVCPTSGEQGSCQQKGGKRGRVPHIEKWFWMISHGGPLLGIVLLGAISRLLPYKTAMARRIFPEIG